MKIFYTDNNYGFAALLTIIIIAAAVLIMAANSSFLSLGELDMGYTMQKGGEVESVAEGCLEEALRRLRLDVNYGLGQGNINLSLADNSCIITVSDLGGGSRQIVVNGASDEYHSKLKAEVLLSGNVITMNNWEELEN